MNKNVLDSGSLEALKQGQVLLTQLRKIGGGKVQMEFAEVKEASKGISPVFLFNKSDSRFSSTSARRAWQAGQPSDVEARLGLNGICNDDQDWYVNDKGHEVLDLNILSPVAIYEGESYNIRVQIVETNEGSEYQLANIERSAKRKGRDGDYILHEGNYVFTNSTIVIGQEPNDVWLKADTGLVNTITDTVQVDSLTGEIFN
tara:strand:+ start:771 stop:1376 length:606 start_codon:yes stop_codon:yes gene_type:complete